MSILLGQGALEERLSCFKSQRNGTDVVGGVTLAVSESGVPSKVLVAGTEAKPVVVVISSQLPGLSSAGSSESNGKADSVETGGNGYFPFVTDG